MPRSGSPSSRTPLVVTALALLGALVAYAILRDSGRAAAPTAAPPEVAVASGARAAAPLERAATLEEEDAAERALLGEPRDVALDAARLVEPPPEDGLTLRVVLGEQGEPAAGALVSFFDAPLHVWSQLYGTTLGMADATLSSAHKRFFQAGPDGRLVVPAVGRSASLAGELPGWYGTLALDPRTTFPEPELVLHPDADLSVRVVGQDGKPRLGVPVSVDDDGTGVPQILWTTTRAPDGLAVFPHLTGIWRLFEERDFHVSLDLPLAQPRSLPIDPEHLPPTPLELTLPPTGSLVVTLEGWQPHMGEYRVGAAVASTADETPRSALTLSEQGRAVFPYVGLGLELTLHVLGREARGSTHTAPGPRRAGERVEIRVPLGELVPLITGRALDGAGMPLAGVMLGAELRFENSGTKRRHESGVLTDGLGRFRLAAREDWPERGEHELDLRTPSGGRAVPLLGSVTWSGLLEPGGNEVGDVRLEPAPLVAAGRVVDDQGQAIGSARVAVRTPRRAAGRILSWIESAGLSTLTDREGAFSIHGTLREPRIQLAATHPHHARVEPLETATGTGENLLVLPSAGRIAGRVLLDEEVPAELLSLGAEPSDEGVRVSASVEADGSFVFRGLLPEPHDVTLRLHGEWEDLLRFSDVYVRNQETTNDPRLAEIDLRGRLWVLDLRVLDAERRPVRTGMVHRRSAGGTEQNGRSYVRRGEAQLVTSAEALDLSVDVPGYQRVYLEHVDGDREIVLQRGLPVRLRIEGGSPPTAGAVRLRASVALETPDAWRRIVVGASFDEAGLAEIVLTAPGTYRVSMQVLYSRGAVDRVANLRGAQTIEVRDTAAEQVFELQLTESMREEIVRYSRDG